MRVFRTESRSYRSSENLVPRGERCTHKLSECRTGSCRRKGDLSVSRNRGPVHRSLRIELGSWASLSDVKRFVCRFDSSSRGFELSVCGTVSSADSAFALRQLPITRAWIEKPFRSRILLFARSPFSTRPRFVVESERTSEFWKADGRTVGSGRKLWPKLHELGWNSNFPHRLLRSSDSKVLVKQKRERERANESFLWSWHSWLACRLGEIQFILWLIVHFVGNSSNIGEQTTGCR